MARVEAIASKVAWLIVTPPAADAPFADMRPSKTERHVASR
jgi:hypothetical protein